MKFAFTIATPQITCMSLAIAVSGCFQSDQPSTAPVEGIVRYQGTPVPDAGVTFTPSHGRPATGHTNAQGEFRLESYEKDDGAVVGEHVVTVSKFTKSSAANDARDGAPSPTPPKPLLPLKYADPRQSPFKADVKPGQVNHFNFDLTD